jgi:hypothetical protein
MNTVSPAVRVVRRPRRSDWLALTFVLVMKRSVARK